MNALIRFIKPLAPVTPAAAVPAHPGTRRLAVLLLPLALLSGCGRNEAAPPVGETKPVMTVEVVSPSTDAWPQTIAANGDVQAWQEAVIGAEVGGARLLEVHVNVGDVVKKGQVLAELDPDTLSSQLSQQEATVAQAEASLAKAQTEAARAEQLDKTGSISQQELDQFRTAAATAAAQLKLARAQREVAGLQLRYAKVVAPDDGVISSRTATVGTVVGAGTELFRLIRNRRLEWRAEVPAAQLAQIKPGMPAQVFRPDGSSIEGRVRQLAPTVDTRTRNGIVYVDLPKDTGLAAGQFVSGRFEVGMSSAITVPESAIVLRDGNSYVMRLDDKSIVHEVKVQTGRRYRQSIEVAGGIAPQDRIVRAGGSFIGEGDLVSVASGAAPAGAAPTARAERQP